MSKDDKVLECNVQPAGCPFTVTEDLKDTLLQPGTTGFISYVMGPDHNHPNIIFQQAVVTRRGKGGKGRINNNMILCPIFKINGIGINSMFPEKEERKYFVNLETKPFETVSIITDVDPIDNNFLAWLLARALLVKELDQAAYPSEHKIMEAIGLNGGQRQVNIWPRDKMSVLKTFVDNIESYYNNNETDLIRNSYSLPEIKDMLLKDIKAKEVLLLIPRLEYQRKVSEVLLNALDWVESFVSKSEDKAIDKVKVIAEINDERDSITQRNKTIEATISKRLNTIARSRIMF